MEPPEDTAPATGGGAGAPELRDRFMRQVGLVMALLFTAICIGAAPYIQPPIILSILVILFSGILYLIRGTRSLSISTIILALLYGLGWLPLLIFVTTLGIVAMGEIAYRAAKGGHHRYLTYFAAASAGGALAMLWTGNRDPLLLLLGVVVAVLLKSVLGERNDVLMIEGLGVAMTMYLFQDLNYPVPDRLLITAIVVAFTFAFFAYRFRVADVSGLFSGALVGILLIVFTGDVRWFVVMLAFLVIGSAATRYRFDLKAEAGIAETHGGMRGYVNVFANGLVGMVAAVLYGLSGGDPLFLALFLGSVATAAADTMGGEIGMTSHEPVLITTLKPVPKGTNGGVTLLGEAASLAASALIALTAYLLGLGSIPLLLAAVLAGFLGANVDSLVGALLENQGVIGNAGTNLVATLSGGLIAAGLFLLLG
ncbi:MAG TPA: TIGR00297 family protein [Methanomicrobiales archaeon]|nr:TIGR00297 family protein [Methanomicrobiales archaeon]